MTEILSTLASLALLDENGAVQILRYLTAQRGDLFVKNLAEEVRVYHVLGPLGHQP